MGRVSCKFAKVQTAYFTSQGSTKSGKKWLIAYIRKQFDVAWDMWQHRNAIKHGEENTRARQELEALDTSIRAEFQTGPTNLLREDQLFFRNEAAILALPRHSKKAWLQSVMLARQETPTNYGPMDEFVIRDPDYEQVSEDDISLDADTDNSGESSKKGVTTEDELTSDDDISSNETAPSHTPLRPHTPPTPAMLTPNAPLPPLSPEPTPPVRRLYLPLPPGATLPPNTIQVNLPPPSRDDLSPPQPIRLATTAMNFPVPFPAEADTLRRDETETSYPMESLPLPTLQHGPYNAPYLEFEDSSIEESISHLASSH